MHTSTQNGQLIESKTGSFPDKKSGEPVHFGKVQIMHRDDNGFFRIKDVKVKRENFAKLEDWKKLIGKNVQVICEVKEFKDGTAFYAADIKAA